MFFQEDWRWPARGTVGGVNFLLPLFTPYSRIRIFTLILPLLPQDFAGWECLSAEDAARMKHRIEGGDPMMANGDGQEVICLAMPGDAAHDRFPGACASSRNRLLWRRPSHAYKLVRTLDVMDDHWAPEVQ